jgi:hypothetical protein
MLTVYHCENHSNTAHSTPHSSHNWTANSFSSISGKIAGNHSLFPLVPIRSINVSNYSKVPDIIKGREVKHIKNPSKTKFAVSYKWL